MKGFKERASGGLALWPCSCMLSRIFSHRGVGEVWDGEGDGTFFGVGMHQRRCAIGLENKRWRGAAILIETAANNTMAFG